MAIWTMAIGGSDHDFSVALMCDNDIRIAIEQERLSRIKHSLCEWYEDPVHLAIDYCLKSESLQLTDIDHVVGADTLPACVMHRLGSQLQTFPHHLCHAASAYLMAPANSRAGVMVIDGYGSILAERPHHKLRVHRETFSFFIFDPNGYQHLGTTAGLAFTEQDDYPICVTNSLGLLFELVTGLLGYGPMEAGKTMGLAAYGTPKYLDELKHFVSIGNTADNCFSCPADDPRFIATLKGILENERFSFGSKADLAASLQALTNETFVRCAGFFEDSAIGHLCISGGCGLNAVANTHVIEVGVNVPVTIPPHCNDAGLAFGALWLSRFESARCLPSLTFRGANLNPALSRPGKTYSVDEIERAAREFYPKLSIDCSVQTPEAVARLVAEGNIVGFFNGRAESGPRALGGRSILADPRNVASRERLNREIKLREPYRPLSPMVLDSHYDEFFAGRQFADPFMLKVTKVSERCREKAPAVVHADQTARPQVVGPDSDRNLLRLLNAYYLITGVPMILNTSFNRAGRPIVETPFDAFDAFLEMGLDGLYIEGLYYRAVSAQRPVC